VAANRFPSSTFLPSSTVFPSDVQWITPAGIASLEAHGASLVTKGFVTIAAAGIATAEAVPPPRIRRPVYAVAIPSAESFGGPGGAPYPDAYPKSSRFPRTTPQGLRISIQSAIFPFAIATAAAHGLSEFTERTFAVPPRFQPVGRPRTGLRPGFARYPGAGWDAVLIYKRIRFPSTTAKPSRGQFPDRYDVTPRALFSYGVVTDRDAFQAARVGTFHKFVASIVAGGHLSAHGVFSSDPSAKLPVMVDMSDGVVPVDLADGVFAVELAPTETLVVEIE
jgi:hypothetical protein